MDVDRARAFADAFAPLAGQARVHAYWVAWTLLQASAFAVPIATLGLVSSRLGCLLRQACGIASTVPSLALLTATILLFDSRTSSVRWFLVVCAAPDIARGMMTGVRAIDPALLEVARALGLPVGFRMRAVIVPLAMRGWLHGLRDAASTTIATTAIAALAGAGGFGASILRGLQGNDASTAIVAALALTAFALVVRVIFVGLERVLVPRPLREFARHTRAHPHGGRPSDRG